MRSHTPDSPQPKRAQCCHCCVSCSPNLEVQPGKCVICPVFGRECNYGLECETDQTLINMAANPQKIRQIPIRPHSQNNPNMRAVQQSPAQSRVQAVGTPQIIQPIFQNIPNATHHHQPQPLYIPVIPLVHLLPSSQQLHTSHVVMNLPVLQMMRPRLANSTLAHSDTRSQPTDQPTDQPPIPNPQILTTPNKSRKLNLSLTQKTNYESPIKQIAVSQGELEL